MARSFIIDNSQNYVIDEIRGYPLGEQPYGYGVTAMFSSSEGIYVGGSSKGYYNRIALWDGQKWNKLGDGIIPYSDYNYYNNIPFVTCIIKYKENIYAALRGQYSINNQKYDKRTVMFKYENHTWKPIIYDSVPADADWPSQTYHMISTNNYLYVCGGFYSKDNQRHTILRWDGKQFTRIDNNSFYECFNLLTTDSGLFAAGSPVENQVRIKKYNGSWSDLPALPSSGDVYSIIKMQDSIYAGIWGGNIYKLDNDIWTTLSDQCILRFITGSDGLYAIGCGENFGESLIKWNGEAWLRPNKKLRTNSNNDAIYNILSCSDGVYVGSIHSIFNDDSGSYISRWNGSQWNRLGDIKCLALEDLVGQENTLITNMISKSEGLYITGFIEDSIRLYNGNELIKLSDDLSWSHYTNVVSNSGGIYFNTFKKSSEATNTVMCRWNGNSVEELYYGINGEDHIGYAEFIYGTENGVYASLNIYNSNTDTTHKKTIFWNGLQFQEFGNFTFEVMKSGSNCLYFDDGESIYKFQNGVTSSIGLPPYTSDSRQTYGSYKWIEMLNNKLYAICRIYQAGKHKDYICSYSSSWTVEYELPAQYNWDNIDEITPDNYYGLVGVVDNKLHISCKNAPQPIQNNSNNSDSLYVYDSNSVQKILDTNSTIHTVCASGDGILYAGGHFTRHGYKIMHVKNFYSEQIKPIVYNTNSVISLRKEVPYRLKTG